MRRLLLLSVLGAGCHFGVSGLPVEIDQGVVLDGGDDALDANVELGGVIDANSASDLAHAPPDFARPIPDGAVPGGNGWPCSMAAECIDGFCIDGFCCDQLCDPFDPANKCRACNVPGSEGTCTFAQDGTDPRGLCDSSAMSTCGQDGLCDGAGGCRLWSPGTLCGTASCAQDTVTGPPACDGNGSCVASTATADCAPYACAADGSGCATSCSAMNDGCQPPAMCNGFGECGLTGLGGSCNDPSQCASNFCSQGVCCSTDCSGLCRSCALANAPGLCTMLADGTDPLNQCTAQTRASCGLDGQCDGAGACRDWAKTTQCAFRGCNGDSVVPARFCDGSGSCAAANPMSCAPYTCNGALGSCYGAPCIGDFECSGNNKCKKGKCG